jgi:hypothetical protein
MASSTPQAGMEEEIQWRKGKVRRNTHLLLIASMILLPLT